MPLRLLEYVVQIYNTQAREWSQRHASFANVRLQPVLPVVFYTGTRRWESVGSLAALVELAERFAGAIPAMDPLFINLPELPARRPESDGGYFGWVLRLVQGRRARPAAFQNLLRRVVEHLETMPDDG